VLESRPYRLSAPLPTDAEDVRRLLARGEVGAAVALYRGPLLPRSDAPGVVRLRDQLHGLVRETLMRSGDPDALLRFADTEHGRHDWQVWQAAWGVLPPSSPRAGQVLAHLKWLERELG
jgi:hypothetical protein